MLISDSVPVPEPDPYSYPDYEPDPDLSSEPHPGGWLFELDTALGTNTLGAQHH